MSKATLAWIAAVSAIAGLICVFFVDRPLALAVHASGLENAAPFVRVREFLDILAGHGLVDVHIALGQLMLGASFVVVGLVCIAANRTSHFGRSFVFAGAVQLLTIETAWLIKDWFARLRPFQVISHGDWTHVWFAGGNSFPSGHNAFFWGLFLPLAYQFPRYRVPLLVIPVFIAFERIDENYHFLSDVLSAIALAATITLVAAFLCGRWVSPKRGSRH